MASQPGPGLNKRFICGQCNKIIEVPYGTPKPARCPYCGAPAYMIHRIDAGYGGSGRGRGGRGGRGWPGKGRGRGYGGRGGGPW